MARRSTRRAASGAAIATVGLLGAATVTATPPDTPASSGMTAAGGTAATAELAGTLEISAAASLTDAYTELEVLFEAANPDVDVVLNFAASSDLVAQITEGAPADVFASADANNMTKLVDAGAVTAEPMVFATNSLTIAVEAGNPEEITGVDDLAARPDLIVVSCDPDVPIGRYAEEVFAAAGVEVEIDSYEENVRAVASKVELGEADAGIVYVTDVFASDDALDSVEIPTDINVIAVYPIAELAESDNPDAAGAFVEWVAGDEAQAVLAEFGFGSPDDALEPAATTSVPGSTTA